MWSIAVKKILLSLGSGLVIFVMASVVVGISLARADSYQEINLIKPYEGKAAASVVGFLIDPIVITNVTDIALGKIVKPLSGTGTYIVNSNGSSSTSGGGVFDGTPSPGSMTIRGSSGTAVSYTAASGDCANPGVQLAETYVNAAPPVLTGTDQYFPVGAKVLVSAQAPNGPATCNFTVRASY